MPTDVPASGAGKTGGAAEFAKARVAGVPLWGIAAAVGLAFLAVRLLARGGGAPKISGAGISTTTSPSTGKGGGGGTQPRPPAYGGVVSPGGAPSFPAPPLPPLPAAPIIFQPPAPPPATPARATVIPAGPIIWAPWVATGPPPGGWATTPATTPTPVPTLTTLTAPPPVTVPSSGVGAAPSPSLYTPADVLTQSPTGFAPTWAPLPPSPSLYTPADTLTQSPTGFAPTWDAAAPPPMPLGSTPSGGGAVITPV